MNNLKAQHSYMFNTLIIEISLGGEKKQKDINNYNFNESLLPQPNYLDNILRNYQNCYYFKLYEGEETQKRR